MKKRVGFAVLAVAVLFAGWYIFTDGALSLDAAKRLAKRAAQDVVASGNGAPEDVAALAVKAISMTQGEKGFELWRLKADWGNMRRNDEIMELEKPRFTYRMPPDNAELQITSNKGEIDQEAQKIRFMDDVVVTFGERSVNTTLIEYFGKTREMIFPDGARIAGRNFAGTAQRIVWRLQENVIEATGNVDITFEGGAVPGFEPSDKTHDTPVADSAPPSGKAQG